jgi:hypothetical protein
MLETQMSWTQFFRRRKPSNRQIGSFYPVADTGLSRRRAAGTKSHRPLQSFIIASK